MFYTNYPGPQGKGRQGGCSNGEQGSPIVEGPKSPDTFVPRDSSRDIHVGYLGEGERVPNLSKLGKYLLKQSNTNANTAPFKKDCKVSIL